MTKAAKALSSRYVTALRSHLAEKRGPNGDRAQGLGRSALASDVTSVKLAAMHEQAMAALASSHSFSQPANGARARADFFITQALQPLEASHRAAQTAARQMQQRHQILRRHATQLAVANRRLEREVARQRLVEAAVRQGKQEYRALFLASQTMQGKLRQLTRQIITAQEQERIEISRELHDEVVQVLVGINVELSALNQEATTGLQAVKARISRTQRLVEHSVNEVHRFSRELRPAVLDDLGLIPALHAYITALAARKKIKIQLTAYAGVEQLASNTRTVLYRVAQEALTNVARHAGATRIKMTISKIPGAIRMEISDNGKSFRPGKAFAVGPRSRLGLIGMKERIEMVGGCLAIESSTGTGTTVRAEVPFNPEKLKS